jgi:tetratricopeptide (TPR) repeat protein
MLQFYQATFQGALKLQDSAMLSAAQANMGIIHYYQQDYESALSQYLKALDLFPFIRPQDKKIQIRKANLLSNIGTVSGSNGRGDRPSAGIRIWSDNGRSPFSSADDFHRRSGLGMPRRCP